MYSAAQGLPVCDTMHDGTPSMLKTIESSGQGCPSLAVMHRGVPSLRYAMDSRGLLVWYSQSA
eukprot:7202-Heterococcus_DN1.PRE.1